MIIRMRRRMRQGDYVALLKKEHGSLDRFARRAERQPALRPLAEEWRWLASHPERADEMMAVDRQMVFHDFERFLEVVTPQRLRLLRYLREHPETDSLSDLARGLGRDYRNVHADAERLAEVGVVELEARGNRVVPRVVAAAVEVEI